MSELTVTKKAMDDTAALMEQEREPAKKADLVRRWWRLKSSYDYCVFVVRNFLGEQGHGKHNV